MYRGGWGTFERELFKILVQGQGRDDTNPRSPDQSFGFGNHGPLLTGHLFGDTELAVAVDLATKGRNDNLRIGRWRRRRQRPLRLYLAEKVAVGIEGPRLERLTLSRKKDDISRDHLKITGLGVWVARRFDRQRR